MTEINHLVQDLRANAHRCPEDLRPMIRDAASALERAAGFAAFGAELEPGTIAPPFPPPVIEEKQPCV